MKGEYIMSGIKHEMGDLVSMAQNGKVDCIIHGCNCQNIMGGGIAKTIRETFPQAWVADCVAAEKDLNVLIANAYTQYFPGRYTTDNNFDTYIERLAAIESSLKKIVNDIGDVRYGIPLIGAGLAGGNWYDIYPIVESILGGYNTTVVHYPYINWEKIYDNLGN
jgi:hypothetical protein